MDSYKTDLLDLRRMDCMDLMAQYPDRHFELAIVDPPYGIGASKYTRGGTQYGKSKARCNNYAIKYWDDSAPDSEYFSHIFRISKNQIIWGANHFISRIPFDSSCWIVWDKDNGEGSGYADCELAWTSFKTAVRRLKWRWSGMLQENMSEKELRIHPTQKPVALYKWLLSKYAKTGDKIIDTHMGSGSIAIACHYAGYHLTACELDQDYFDSAVERIKRETAQLTLELK